MKFNVKEFFDELATLSDNEDIQIAYARQEINNLFKGYIQAKSQRLAYWAESKGLEKEKGDLWDEQDRLQEECEELIKDKVKKKDLN